MIGDMADAEFVYGLVADEDGNGVITQEEMSEAWSYALGECKTVHQIHKDMAIQNGCLSDGGTLAEDGISLGQFAQCLDMFAAAKAAYDAAVAAAVAAAAAAAAATE
jgi:hypothetical protein